MPRAVNAAPGVPCSTAPAASARTPAMRPVMMAVAVQPATACRHTWSFAPLNRTISGSVEIPREALSANP